MDTKLSDGNKSDEMTLLVPSMPQQLTVVSLQNEINEALNPYESRRQRKSYDYQHDLPVARLPSDYRRASNTSLFLEFLQEKLMRARKSKDQSEMVDEATHAANVERENEFRMKNRRHANDALTSALSAFYAKLIVVVGIAFPIVDVLTPNTIKEVYKGFYFYLYIGSIAFVAFMHVDLVRSRRLLAAQNNENEAEKKKLLESVKLRLGSFYLRVGAVAFGIGSMVSSGLEFGQYFELKGEHNCRNVLIALTPATRMILVIVQMQFIFLNSQEFEMQRHKVIVRFGLMHMVATNICEWLYVLVEETRHEISNNIEPITGGLEDFMADAEILTNITTDFNRTKRATAAVACRRTNIMGTLVQNASPFLFPCTIEYSLICAVILFEMWKQCTGPAHLKRSHDRKISTNAQSAHHFSVDCARANKGMLAGTLVIVLTIISLIMFYVLNIPLYYPIATLEVTVTEMILYAVTSLAVFAAFIYVRDLKFSQPFDVMPLDCTLLLLAQSGVYIYCMFSIIGCYFSIGKGGFYGLVAEVFSIVQTSMQTLFILNTWWRRCRSSRENRKKPGREMVTFLLVANIALWSINALVKSRAIFRRTHLDFFGEWSWTIITHVSMPLAIFYRFHSTICLFEIWKTTYKVRHVARANHHN